MRQATDLRFITWNLNVMGASEDRVGRELDFLASQLGDGPAVVALQEASPTAYDVLVRSRLFEWHEYSLVHRPPGPFDRGNRRLGCVLAGNSPAMLRRAVVLARTPFPDRTLMAEIELEGSRFMAISYHSLTGVGYNLTKGAAYRSLLEYLTPRTVPILFGADMNTPSVDHPDLDKSEFCWPKHEPLVFGPTPEHDLKDALRTWLAAHPERMAAIREERPEGPLMTSHMIGKKNPKPARYDAIWASPEWRVDDVRYLFDEAVDAGSDHALVYADVGLGDPRLL